MLTQVRLDAIDLKTSLSLFFMKLLDPEKESSLCSSIREYGILTPIQVWGNENNLIVDGLKRLQLAYDLKLAHIPVVRLDSSASLEIALECRLRTLQGRLTFVQKLKIIRFFYSNLNLSREVIIHQFLPLLQIKGHDNVLRQCLRILDLPDSIVSFCDEKRFSLRQCYQLTRFSSDLLNSFSTRLPYFNFSASVFIECLDFIYDYLRQHDVSVDQFWSNEEISSFLNSTQPETERTLAFRSYLKELRYPVLLARNKDIEKEISQLSPHFNIMWDKSLENKKLTLSFSFQSQDSFKAKLNALGSIESHRVIGEVFNKL